MNIDTSPNGEKDKILELIGHAIDNSDFELECLFNKSSFNYIPNYIPNNIKHENLISIIKRYKGRPDFVSSDSIRLAISFQKSSKYKDVRVLIKGNGPINTYCNNENISLIRNNIDFEEKTQAKANIPPLIIPNYDIKFNLKNEKTFNDDENRINELIRDWDSEMKSYRYKKTFSFTTKAKDFQIDVSIVKSSTIINNTFVTVKEVHESRLYKSVVKPSDVKTTFSEWWKTIESKPNEKVKIRNNDNFYMNFYKNIKESEVFTNIPTYEVEVEYIKNKNVNRPKFKSLIERKDYIQGEYVNFFKHIGGILQCIQNSIYIISRDEKINVKNQFIKVVENSITEKMLVTPQKAKKLANIQTSSRTDLNSDEIDFSKDKKQKEKQAKQEEQKTLESKDKPKGKIQLKTKNIQHGGDSGDSSSSVSGSSSSNSNLTYSKTTMDADNELHFETIGNNNSLQSGGNKIINDDGGGGDGDGDNDNNDGEGGNNDGNVYDGNGGNNDGNVDDGNVDDSDDGDDETYFAKGGVRKLADLKYQIVEKLRNNKNRFFFGPLIVDLLHSNAAYIDPNTIPDIKTNTNIHINYLVTDKTDGERNLLFFDNSGKLYGIDRESNIKSYGAIMPNLANSILDGEHVIKSEDNKILNNFYVFDAYIYKGENVMIKPFLFNKQGLNINGRHYCICETAKYAETGMNITQFNIKLPFRIFKKDYFPSNTPESYESLRPNEIPVISNSCNIILNKMNVKYGGFLEVGHLFSYKTDGLVFLPNNLAIFQSYEGDYSNPNPFRKDTWRNNYKWKPFDHLTIDFKIEIVKEFGTNKYAYKYFDSNKKYVPVNLITAVYQSNNLSKYNNNNKLNFWLLNNGNKLQSVPEDFKFFATDPFVGSYNNEGVLQNNMGESYFEVGSNDNILCENGDFITDGVICECLYDTSINNITDDINMRWKPMRVRADKQSPNNYPTAVTAWSLINKPITKELLCMTSFRNDTGVAAGVASGISGVAAGVAAGVDTDPYILANIDYYSSNQNMIKLTDPFTKFASFVKRYLIERGLSGYVKPKVLDLGVGRFGDLDKYVKAGVHTLVGIDINEHNINNPVDGAATRMMNLSNNDPAISKLASKTILIIGTSTENIINGECTFDNINKYYIDVLYGRAKGNTPKLKKMESVGTDGFDMVTCMYAIHYSMNNETELDNFLRNVSENLLDQGYFIGTCLNADAVLSEMGSNSEITGEINGKTVFLIKKEDSDPDAYKTITVGNKINVFFETFGSAYSENLVSIEYLKTKAKQHNLKLIDYKTFLEEPGNLLSMFESSSTKNIQQTRLIRNSNALMTWAKFNCYFMFQKVRKEVFEKKSQK